MKRRRINAKSGSPGEPALAPGRQWLFRLAALVIVPLLLLGGLETVLRFAGYGYNTHFFSKLHIGDQDYWVNNDQFALRFFPPELTRFPAPIRMVVKKPPGTYRIFILGESAAMGDPEPAFGAGRYLQALLRERYPDEKFEVINVGVTAINSHVVLPIARECARHEGDLWIVYMGNNEMVGPYGAATVFGPQAPPLGFVRLSLAIQKARVGQLLMAGSRKLKRGSAKAPSSWAGMQMFVENRVPPNDRRRETVSKNFQKNLHDILRAGLDSGAKVLLSTVAVNLKDCPPFASMSDDSADQEFKLGSLMLSTNAAAARQHFQKACDEDALPFRADSHINGAIAQAGRDLTTQGVVLCDAAAVLPPGQETFYEHVHFNFDGNYQLARAWVEQVQPLLPAAITNHTAGSGWASQETCERRVGLTDWNRRNVIAGVIRRMHDVPLSGQSNNEQRLAALQAWQEKLRAGMNSNAVAEARALYQDALKRAPEDHYLHENYADFLVATGDPKAATAEWREVHKMIPQDFVADFRIGGLLAVQGNYAEAETLLRQTVALHPAFADGWLELGETCAAQGNQNQALENYERARKLRPQDPELHFHMGQALTKSKRSSEAMEHYREAIRLNPNYWEPHFALGGELGLQDKIKDAGREFQIVVQLKPDHAMAHLNLGVALMKSGQLDGAEHEFEETLRLDPVNKFAPDYLRQLRVLKGK